MGLFDDDFYSPKLSRWRKRRIASESPSWSFWRRWSGRYAAIAAASAVTGGLVVFLALSPWLFAGKGSNAGAVPEADQGNEADAGYAGVVNEPERVVNIVESVKPTIVSVITTQGDDAAAEGQEASLGSGIAYSIEGNKGKIVTNFHVIDGASAIEVVLYDGTRLESTLVGGDPLTDLAVLEVDGRKLPAVAKFGNSDKLREGEAVIAIGHPFGLGYSPTSTLGIISSLHRIIPISLAMNGNIDWEMDLLQTDAAINHGNSGGALIGLDGKVIGINSMKVSLPGVEGLGFAIPSNLAVSAIQELEQYGKVRRPYMGVATVDLAQYRGIGDEGSGNALNLPDDVKDGIIVLEAYGPSQEAGLTTNDVIVALDDTSINSTLALRRFLYTNKKIGDSVKVTYYRAGKKDMVSVKLTENPNQ